MEQENQNKEKTGGNGGNRRPRHRGGRRSHGQKPAVKDNRTPAEQAAQVARTSGESGAPQGAQNQNKAGEHSGGNGRRHHRSRGGRGRDRERNGAAVEAAARPNEGAARREEAKKEELTGEITLSPLAGRFGDDRWLDDTFSPLHEVEIHDPAAEAAAKARLDAEGPLLFREEPVTEAAAEDEEPVERVEIVGVRFKVPGKVYYFAPGSLKLSLGSYAIVETARGPEYGEVALANTMLPASEIVQPLRPVLRMATAEDAAHQESNKQREAEAFRICQTKIAEHGLEMKLVEAQYTFDNSKLLFYFTSDGRVDFRDLVKDLAGVFRTRIELRQIGIRDEAKLLGGLGACGRGLCCAGFLPDFVQVSIKMAKEQNLSLNSTKISGACGRLMCCLRYEHETYEEEIRRTPPVDATVETRDGVGTVISNHPLKGTVTVRLSDRADEPPHTYHRDEVKVLRQKREDRAPRDKQEGKEEPRD